MKSNLPVLLAVGSLRLTGTCQLKERAQAAALVADRDCRTAEGCVA